MSLDDADHLARLVGEDAREIARGMWPRIEADLSESDREVIKAAIVEAALAGRTRARVEILAELVEQGASIDYFRLPGGNDETTS